MARATRAPGGHAAFLLAALLLALLLSLASPVLVPPTGAQVADDGPPVQPDPSRAVDLTNELADIGYRKIDSAPHSQSRTWLMDAFTDMGHLPVEQRFTTDECSDCSNILVTVPGRSSTDLIVVGAHYDAICYTTAPGIPAIELPGCSSDGAYDDATGIGILLELARLALSWQTLPQHTWVFAAWDYEEWQGSGTTEGGEQGSRHYVESLDPALSISAYVNLDMVGLNWPVHVPALPGCGEDQFTLYMFTSPAEDWSYYEGEGLEVTDTMRTDAQALHAHLDALLHTDLAYPTDGVVIIDDDAGQSDHHRFIRAGWPATWFRGMHQYVWDEGDTCEQSFKHSPTDSMATLEQYAGGRDQLEAGFKTVLDAVALWMWWDTNLSRGVGPEARAALAGQRSEFGPLWIGLVAITGVGLWMALSWASERQQDADQAARAAGGPVVAGSSGSGAGADAPVVEADIIDDG